MSAPFSFGDRNTGRFVSNQENSGAGSVGSGPSRDTTGYDLEWTNNGGVFNNNQGGQKSGLVGDDRFKAIYPADSQSVQPGSKPLSDQRIYQSQYPCQSAPGNQRGFVQKEKVFESVLTFGEKNNGESKMEESTSEIPNNPNFQKRPELAPFTLSPLTANTDQFSFNGHPKVSSNHHKITSSYEKFPELSHFTTPGKFDRVGIPNVGNSCYM